MTETIHSTTYHIFEIPSHDYLLINKKQIKVYGLTFCEFFANWFETFEFNTNYHSTHQFANQIIRAPQI